MVDLEPLPEVEPGSREPQPNGHAKIIRAADATLIFDGQERLEIATREAVALLEKAKIRYQEEVQRGYEEGRQAGEESVAKLLNDTVANTEQYIVSREAELVDLVLMTTQNILESFDDHELASQMLKKAVKERRAMRGMSLYVHPSGQDAFVKALDEIRQEIGHIDDMISVNADVSLEPGVCVLDTPLGYVQLGIEAQLEALRNGLLLAFSANPIIASEKGPEDRDDADA